MKQFGNRGSCDAHAWGDGDAVWTVRAGGDGEVLDGYGLGIGCAARDTG